MVSPRIRRADARPRHIRSRTSDRPLGVFATDLDRTLLRPRGRPTIVARAALRAARAFGLRTLLVSGRRYPELLAFARAFGEFDGLVAENGAVVEAPLGAALTVAGRRTAARVRARLAGYPGLHGEWGEVVVAIPRTERRRLLPAIADLPVDVIPNVDRLMVLPAGVTKYSGTRRAMRQMGLEGNSYAAIGDGENDVDLLRGALLSGAVANAAPVARRVAGYRCRASFEQGVLEFVRGPLGARVREARLESEVSAGPTARARALR